MLCSAPVQTAVAVAAAVVVVAEAGCWRQVLQTDQGLHPAVGVVVAVLCPRKDFPAVSVVVLVTLQTNPQFAEVVVTVVPLLQKDHRPGASAE